jgi:hypothetical protein
MARPRTPTNVLEIRGAFKKHPERKREDPEPAGELGEPPRSSSRASCCICCPRASSASAITACSAPHTRRCPWAPRARHSMHRSLSRRWSSRSRLSCGAWPSSNGCAAHTADAAASRSCRRSRPHTHAGSPRAHHRDVLHRLSTPSPWRMRPPGSRTRLSPQTDHETSSFSVPVRARAALNSDPSNCHHPDELATVCQWIDTLHSRLTIPIVTAFERFSLTKFIRRHRRRGTDQRQCGSG